MSTESDGLPSGEDGEINSSKWPATGVFKEPAGLAM